MKAYVITLGKSIVSNTASNRLKDSSRKVDNEFQIEKFNAHTPDDVKSLMTKYKIKWNYPWVGSQLDLSSGLQKTAYETADPNKRIACFLSHYTLWKKCVDTDEPILIFEHDAIFTKKLDMDMLYMSKYDIIALNDPRGATRRAQLYYDMVRRSALDIVAVPKIDDDQIPQGLPGNSAYFIKPKGALKLLNAVREYGAWPNDAIMCKQLLPNTLGIVRDFVTQVQGIKSTTTL